MIQEEYCSFEVAKLLKEKGFDEPCRAYWDNQPLLKYRTLFWSVDAIQGSKRVDGEISCPTHQMAMKWLREKNIFINVEPFITISSTGHNLHGYKPWVCTFKSNWINPLHKQGKIVYVSTYEEATEAALKYALEELI